MPVLRSPAGPRTTFGWILLIASFQSVVPFAMDMYLPGLPVIAKALDASEAAAQLTVTAVFFCAGIGQLVAGPISDRLGRRPVILVGLSIYTAGCLLATVSPNIATLIVARILSGLGAGAALVLLLAIVRDRHSTVNVARMFLQMTAVVGVVIVAAPLVGSTLLRYTGWRGMLLGTAVLAVGILVNAFLRTPETRVAVASDSGVFRGLANDAQALLRDRNFVAYLTVMLMLAASMFALIAGLTFVLQEEFHLSAQQYGLILAIDGVGVVGASYTASRLTSRFGPRRVIGVGLGVCVVAAFLAVLGLVIVPNAWIASAALIVVVIGFTTASPPTRAMASHHHAARAGAAFALLGIVQYGGGGLAAPLTGLLPMSTSAAVALITAVAVAGGIGAYAVALRSGTNVQAHH